MKVYGPDITKRGTNVVTIYTEKQKEGVFTEEKEEKILMEFHTDNPIYADIYFGAITNVINDIPGVNTIHHRLKWRLRSSVPKDSPKRKYLGNAVHPPDHPWSHFVPAVYNQCPLKYKRDLIPYVAKFMKWTKTKTQAKKKSELQQIWAYKNLKHITGKGTIPF